MVLGFIVFGLGMGIWAYKMEQLVEHVAEQVAAESPLPVSVPSDLDVFLGLSVVGVGLFILGVVVWIDSLLPREHFD
jgi:hypothetical protein